jgi:5-methylcytosine-specific restriction protein A
MSIVEGKRKQLEALGEYVIRANASSGWFAVFPKKLTACRQLAQGSARADFNLVVYRTVDGDERDHWAIPFSFASQAFTEGSLTHSDVNGIDRWNCTFRSGILHVTHTEQDIDCTQFHRRRLIVEDSRPDVALPEEVAEDEVYAEGNVTRISVNRYERDPGARTQCIAIHGPACAICGFDFGLAYGQRMNGFIHVHHVTPLHQIGERYQVKPRTDMIPVCPNCHAVIHSKREPMSVEEVRQLLKQEGEQAAPSNGGKRSSLNSDFHPRRG